MPPRDDSSFEELMARAGVQPLPRSGRAGGQGQAPSAARGPAGGAGGRAPGPGAPRPTPPERPRDPLVLRAEALLAESEQARSVLEAARAEDARAYARAVAALETELAAARAAVPAAEEARDAAIAARDEAIAGREAARAALEAAGAARVEAEAAREAALARRRSVADALLARGCVDELEMLAVVNGLLLQRPRELLEALVLADPHELEKVLVERVAFVWPGAGFQPDPNTVVVAVDKARCEICSGSDIKASFHGFVQACLDAGVSRVTVVGGSPAYRKQLDALAAAHPDAPKLSLVSGTRRREERRAQADLRGSDLVVVWGATELDHSVTDHYRGGPARIVRVAHRGIARMLQLVRSELRR